MIGALLTATATPIAEAVQPDVLKHARRLDPPAEWLRYGRLDTEPRVLGPLYHGSPCRSLQTIASAAGATGDESKNHGIFFTPSRAIAEEYANRRCPPAGRVYEVEITTSRALYLQDINPFCWIPRQRAKALRALGVDCVIRLWPEAEVVVFDDQPVARATDNG